MFVNTNNLVAESGMAVILKNNKPRYVIVDFDEYDEIQAVKLAREKKIFATADTLIDENLEAFNEIAK